MFKFHMPSIGFISPSFLTSANTSRDSLPIDFRDKLREVIQQMETIIKNNKNKHLYEHINKLDFQLAPLNQNNKKLFIQIFAQFTNGSSQEVFFCDPEPFVNDYTTLENCMKSKIEDYFNYVDFNQEKNNKHMLDQFNANFKSIDWIMPVLKLAQNNNNSRTQDTIKKRFNFSILVQSNLKSEDKEAMCRAMISIFFSEKESQILNRLPKCIDFSLLDVLTSPASYNNVNRQAFFDVLALLSDGDLASNFSDVVALFQDLKDTSTCHKVVSQIANYPERERVNLIKNLSSKNFFCEFLNHSQILYFILEDYSIEIDKNTYQKAAELKSHFKKMKHDSVFSAVIETLKEKDEIKHKNINGAFTASDELNKEGVIWKYKGTEKIKSEIFHIFQLDKKFNYFNKCLHQKIKQIQHEIFQINKDIFPATEPRPQKFLNFCQDIGKFSDLSDDIVDDSLGKIFKTSPNLKETFKGLGFSVDITNEEFNVILPDIETLQNRWNKIQQLHDKAKLKFSNSNGIANDADFVASHFTSDAIISDGKEFIHDMGIHVIPTLVRGLLSTENEYEKEKERTFGLLKHLYNKILMLECFITKRSKQEDRELNQLIRQCLDIAIFSIGIFVDNYTADTEIKPISSFKISSTIQSPPPIHNIGLISYFKSRFKNNDLDPAHSIKLAWEVINILTSEQNLLNHS